MKKQNNIGWTTKDEMEFIAKMGRFTSKDHRLAVIFTRQELLRGYLVGSEKRADWNSIDRSAVILFAKEELAREERIRNP